MSLKSELVEILHRMREAVGVYIMDADGLVVEKAESGASEDLESAFIEFMQGFRNISASAEELKLGPVQELSILTGGNRYLFRRLDHSYFLVLAMKADGCLGEGSYRLRRAARNMAGEFGP